MNKYSPMELLKFTKIINSVIASHFSLENINKEQLNNKDYLLEIVKQNGLVLEHTNKELQNDKEVVLEAVKQNGLALKYASFELKNDKEFLREAINTNIETFPSLIFINKDYLSDPKIIEATIDKFSKYECSKDYDLDSLKNNPNELLNIINSNDFTEEPLIKDKKNEIQIG